MKESAALKQENIPIESQEHKGYEEDIRQRFVEYRQTSGDSLHKIGLITGLSEATLSEFQNEKYKGDKVNIAGVIDSKLFAKKESQKITPQTIDLCPTENVKKTHHLLEFCSRRPNMGLLIGASGTGKTSAVNDWLFERWWATGFSVGITTKTCGAVLQKICRILNIHTSQTISEAFDRVISRLKGSKRMLIFDESHFLSWEALELLRQIHDSAGISIVLSGQPILYSQMKGTRKGYLFDQLYSRIGMKCYLKGWTLHDVGLVARSICPTLNEDCIKFLFECCRREGRFRSVVKILGVALDASQKLNTPLSRKFLNEIYNEFFSED